MLDWVIENKEWLFSGAGISVLTIIFLFFKKKSSKKIAPQHFLKNHIGNSNIGRDININQTVNDHSSNQELISILSHRAEKIRNDFYQYTHVKKIQPLADDIDKFENLHLQHIEALKNNNLTLAHEILNSINNIFNEYRYGKKHKKIIKENKDFLMSANYCKRTIRPEKKSKNSSRDIPHILYEKIDYLDKRASPKNPDKD